jgi:VWFA-related protein
MAPRCSRTSFVALAVVCASFTAAIALEPTQQPIFRSSSDLVVAYASVRSRSGHLVSDLAQQDFSVLVDGRPVRLETFSNDTVPITAVLMLDMSNSVAPDATFVANAAAAFVDALSSQDRAAIGSFGAEVAVSPVMTGDKALLKRVLSEELWPGGATPLWSAIRAAMNRVTAESGRRVVVVFTDGADSCPISGYDTAPPSVELHGARNRGSRSLGTRLCATARDVAKQALDGELLIYALELRTETKVYGASVSGLRRLAEETGGGHFLLSKRDELMPTFAALVDELHHQYVLGFRPEIADNKQHRIEVRTVRADLTVSTRKTFAAVRQQ